MDGVDGDVGREFEGMNRKPDKKLKKLNLKISVCFYLITSGNYTNTLITTRHRINLI